MTNRIIKFRAWIHRPLPEDEMVFFGLGEVPTWLKWTDPLMQYTGLKDKNGVEIYEGDIIKRTYIGTSDLSIVVFRKSSFMLKNPKEEAFASMPVGDFEVMGNQFENPEFLTPLPEGEVKE